MSDPQQPQAYETPDDDRAASAAPTESQLAAEPESPPHDPYSALRLNTFRLYLTSAIFSTVGMQVQTAAIGWEIFQRTHNALDLGWLGLILAIPMLVMTIPAGHLADIRSRRVICVVTMIISGLCSLGLVFVSRFFGTHPHQIAMMYALLFAGAIASTFGRPARQAILPQIVPAHVFSNAVTWNSSAFELSSMGGAAIGGLLVWLTSPSFAYLFTTLCWAACWFCIYSLPDKPPTKRAKAAGLSDLIAGVKFVFQRRLMLAALTLDLFAVLLGGATFLLPMFAEDILHVGAFGYGWLRAAPSIGACSMAMIQAHRPPLKNAGKTLLVAVFGFGLATVVFGLSKSYTLSFLMLVITGLCDNLSVVIRHTLVQLLTPDDMRGRVSAVNQIFIGSSNELGGFESGLTAKLFTPVISVVGGGIGAIAVVIAVAFGWPQVRRLKKLNDLKPDELPSAQIPSPGTPGEV